MLKAPQHVHLDRGVHEHCLVTRDSLDPTLRRFLRRELTNILSNVD
jgi:hypothetical protein